jgi:hypothetical protein
MMNERAGKRLTGIDRTRWNGKSSRGRGWAWHLIDPNRKLKKLPKVAVDDFEMMRVLGKGCVACPT